MEGLLVQFVFLSKPKPQAPAILHKTILFEASAFSSDDFLFFFFFFFFFVSMIGNRACQHRSIAFFGLEQLRMRISGICYLNACVVVWGDLKSSHVDSKRNKFRMGGRGFWLHSYAINQKT